MSTDDSFKKNRRFSRLAPTILPLRIDDSFRKHRRLFFKSPWMLGEINLLHFQKESFPAFTGLFFSSSTESADNLTEVILHQQTPANKTLVFFVDKTVISDMLYSGDLLGRAKICACYWRTGINETESLLWLTPYKKGNDSGIYSTCHFPSHYNIY